MDIIKKLTPADYVSFAALLCAWLSIVFLIKGNTVLAINISLGAFLFDILDGYIARKLQVDSHLGRQIDSFVDIVTYLLFSTLLIQLFISPSIILGAVVNTVILIFGGLRLIRYNNEGILQDNNKSFYRGVTVVHIYFATIYIYFLTSIYSQVQIIGTLAILILAPFMLSNFKSYKIYSPILFAVIIIGTVVINLLIHGN